MQTIFDMFSLKTIQIDTALFTKAFPYNSTLVLYYKYFNDIAS